MTGSQKGAGTPDPGVYITLVGSNGHSGKLYLQSFLTVLLRKCIDEGTSTNIVVESCGDLGQVLVVILGNDDGPLKNRLTDPWYVEDVGVYNYQSKQQEVFPCYHWIANGDCVSFTAHTSNHFGYNSISMI